MLIYKFNSSGKESFSNNNKNNKNNNADESEYNQDVPSDLKEPLALLTGVSSERIENIKITGVNPDIQIYFDVLPRSADDSDEPTLENVVQKLDTLKMNMDYIIRVDGTDHHFKTIHTKSYKKDKTNTDELTSKFVDPTLKKQIKYLKELQTLIGSDYNTDNFLTFNKNGNLELKPNTLPATSEPETGAINSM
jgi:hypothetical protein